MTPEEQVYHQNMQQQQQQQPKKKNRRGNRGKKNKDKAIVPQNQDKAIVPQNSNSVSQSKSLVPFEKKRTVTITVTVTETIPIHSYKQPSKMTFVGPSVESIDEIDVPRVTNDRPLENVLDRLFSNLRFSNL